MDFLTENYATVEMQELMVDRILSRACVKSLEIIGEASRNISEDLKKVHPEVLWRQMTDMRLSPLERGRADVWAAAIVYALGNVNFLFDKSQVPHLRADELAGLFGISQKTAANKARRIREILKIRPVDPR
jgi:hypothetical protein